MGQQRTRQDIPYLIPDMPEYYQLARYLQKTDKQRWYSNFGPLVDELEHGIIETFFPSVSADRVVTCSSGTAAIELALKSLGLAKGARILVPSLTFAATITAIVNSGFEPVFSDVCKDSWLLTPEVAMATIGWCDIDVVLPVSMLGMPQSIEHWDDFIKSTEIPVILDAAPAIEHQKISDISSVIVCFSLHATKAFGIGEGGLVVFPNKGAGIKGRILTNFGFDQGSIDCIGSNYKLSEYHAAVGLAQLERWSEVKSRRATVRAHYQTHNGELKNFYNIQRNVFLDDSQEVSYINNPVFFSSVVVKLNSERLDKVDSVVTALKGFGVEARKWYRPIHQHPAFEKFMKISAAGDSLLPVTEDLGSNLIGLPFHNFLTQKDIGYVVGLMLEILGESKNKYSLRM